MSVITKGMKPYPTEKPLLTGSPGSTLWEAAKWYAQCENGKKPNEIAISLCHIQARQTEGKKSASTLPSRERLSKRYLVKTRLARFRKLLRSIKAQIDSQAWTPQKPFLLDGSPALPFTAQRPLRPKRQKDKSHVMNS